MKKLLEYINANVLFKVANLNSITIGIKILAGLLTSKAIAVFIGAEGMALIGNLRNFLSAVQSFSIAGFYNGLVKYIGQYKDDVNTLSKTLSTVFYLGFFTSILMSFVCYYNAHIINDFLFSESYNYAYVIEVLAIALPFYALNMFSFSIMNGFSKYKILLIINIIGQILGLLITLLLIWQDNIDGALIAVVITPSLIFLITLVGILNRKNFISLVKITNMSSTILNKLSPYAIMAIVSSIAIPIVLILIRNYVISNVGIKAAGYWEAMNRISEYYLMFINSLMALYIIPRFAEIHTRSEFRKEVWNFYKSVMPVFAVMLVTIFLIRNVIINVIFTPEFRQVESLFAWQIAGDFLRVLSMVIAYQFLAKKMFTHFIILEIFLFVILYFSSIYFIDLYGIQGAVIGHCFSYFLHFLIVLLLFSSSLFGVITESDNT
ncbi:MAG: O-antigen translocase [Winogradskyella sp.]|nr:O-antigen translocase [Winogradskyella sp.]MBT8377278.1 O-antigen translocase [Bacteroidia bacterium]NNK40356.1 O-antigen translocase [Winogradskyella sp.]